MTCCKNQKEKFFFIENFPRSIIFHFHFCFCFFPETWKKEISKYYPIPEIPLKFEDPINNIRLSLWSYSVPKVYFYLIWPIFQRCCHIPKSENRQMANTCSVNAKMFGKSFVMIIWSSRQVIGLSGIYSKRWCNPDNKTPIVPFGLL